MNEAMKALRKMHNLERLATEIYRVQTGAFREEEEIADRLQAATLNEQEHIDDLEARIDALGGSASPLGLAFQMAGKTLGMTTRLLGKNCVLRTDARIEEKAIQDYNAFLDRVDFDAKSRALIKNNTEDERLHVRRWQDSMEILKRGRAPRKGKEEG